MDHLHYLHVSLFKVQKYLLTVYICICYMYRLQIINCMYKLFKSQYTLACTSGLVYIYIGHVSLDIVDDNKEKIGEWGWGGTSNAALPLMLYRLSWLYLVFLRKLDFPPPIQHVSGKTPALELLSTCCACITCNQVWWLLVCIRYTFWISQILCYVCMYKVYQPLCLHPSISYINICSSLMYQSFFISLHLNSCKIK